MSMKLDKIKTFGVMIPVAAAFTASVACASVGVNVNINVGAPQPVIVPVQPTPPMPYVTIEQDVDFVYPSELGFYVAVGVPYDLFYLRNNYYLCRDGRWFRADSSRGPWIPARYRDLPPGLRTHTLDRIRVYRNAEYTVYSRDRDHYRGRHFRTAKEDWRALHKAEKEYRKEERRDEREYRKDMKREDREERKMEKEERKHFRHDRD